MPNSPADQEELLKEESLHVGRGNETTTAQASEGIAEVGLSVPDKGSTNPSPWLGGNVEMAANE